MAKAGETLSNPMTGERVVARVMASETNGAYATGDYFIPAGLSVPDHFHPGLEGGWRSALDTFASGLAASRRSLGRGSPS